MFISKSKKINRLPKFFIVFIIVMLFTSIFSINVIAKDYSDNGKKDSKSNSDSKSDSSSSDKGSLRSNSALSKSSNDMKSENSDSDSDKDSDENDEDSEDKSTQKTETKIITDEQGRKVTVETKTETNGKGGTETEEKRTFIDEFGNKVTIETETKIENGKNEIEVKRKIITPDGTEIIFKTETKIKDGRTETKISVEVEGVGFETKLTIKEEFEEGKAILKAKLSTGAEQDIITTPDEVLKTALAEIGGKNINIELKEVLEKGQKEAVFSAKTTNLGRFLGIFDTSVNLETLINTQTGEIIKTNKPWWAFLVVGYNKATICHVSEENKNKKVTLEIAIPAVKSHLAHGDSVGKCAPICRDGILEKGEICETGINETQVCTTTEGYAGTEACNSLCNGYDVCITTESCGDGIVNGLEACDDGNTINGDGCNSLCQIEIITNGTNQPPSNQTNNTTV
ncbi:MAG: myxococcus cysteine-rich repeat containing protein [Nanoarchaeota archaeon]